MSHECDSCGHAFVKATELFQHIQTSCLSYYKKHPKSWSRLLSDLSPEEEDETVSIPPEVKTDSPPLKSSTPYESSSLGLKGSEESEAKKETPFCIMFRAQNQKGGKKPKNIHMTVSEYFYAQADGHTLEEKKTVRRNNCYSCGKTLRNNLRFMSHLRHKVVNEWEKTRATEDMCCHCFRYYDTPFLLQCHLENVHGSQPASCTCCICELHFPSERIFLFHMKDKHVYNEMPYSCKLCHFRSSFYNDVIKHFRETHNDTLALMCPFCLTVQHNSNTFLKHAITHIKKVFECTRCRLQFISPKDRMLHLENDHGTKDVKSKPKSFQALSCSQVFVRVASFSKLHAKQTTPHGSSSTRQKKQELADVKTRSTPSSGAKLAKLQSTSSGADLPAYLCPLKRSNGLRIVRWPEVAKKDEYSVSRCCECKEELQPTSENFLNHFSNMHECRWCIYVTACERASRNHVLKEHADAEMREQLTSECKAECDEQMDDSAALSKTTDEGLSEVAILPVVETDNENSSQIASNESPQMEYPKRKGGSPDANSLLKKRRKQENPMRFPDEDNESPGGSEVQKQEIEEGPNAPADACPTFINETQSSPLFKTVMKARRKTYVTLGREGWSKYFQQQDSNKSTTGRLILPKQNDLPTMVPSPPVHLQTAPGPNLPPLQPLKQKKLLADAVSPQPALPQKPKTQVLLDSPQNVPLPTYTKADVVKLCPVSSNLLSSLMQMTPLVTSSLPSTIAPCHSKSGPVYQFQIIPSTMRNSLAAGSCVKTTQQHNYILPKPAPVTTVAPIVQGINVPSVPATTKTVVINPSEFQVPQPPYNLRCLVVTPSSLLIRWEPPISGPVTSYKVIFQGSGAPTVQMLPREQTLVRLVGLKSNTMYIIRVHTLHKNMSSPYAFIFQRTKKLRKTQRANRNIMNAETKKETHKDRQESMNDDVIMVIDDEEEGKEHPQASDQTYLCSDKSDTDRLSNLTETGTFEVDSARKLVPKPKQIELIKQLKSYKQIDFCLDTSEPVAGVEPVKKWVFKPKQKKVKSPDIIDEVKLYLERERAKKKKKEIINLDIINEVKLHLEREKAKKKSLIDELLKGMKKNKQSKQNPKAVSSSITINESSTLNIDKVEMESIVSCPVPAVASTVEISSENDPPPSSENTDAVNADNASSPSSTAPEQSFDTVQDTFELSDKKLMSTEENVIVEDMKGTKLPSSSMLEKLLDIPQSDLSMEEKNIAVQSTDTVSCEQRHHEAEKESVEPDSIGMEEENNNNIEDEEPQIEVKCVVSLGPVTEVHHPKRDTEKQSESVENCQTREVEEENDQSEAKVVSPGLASSGNMNNIIHDEVLRPVKEESEKLHVGNQIKTIQSETSENTATVSADMSDFEGNIERTDDPIVTPVINIDGIDDGLRQRSSEVLSTSSECNNTPTLDDIRNIMENEVMWLQ